jgi:PAS domain S-box-containing protein
MIKQGRSESEQKQFIEFVYRQLADAFVYFACSQKFLPEDQYPETNGSKIAANFVFHDANAAFSNLMHEELHSTRDRTLFDLLGAGFVDFAADFSKLVQQGAHTCTLSLLRKDNSVARVEASFQLARDEEGCITGMFAVLRDVTLKKEVMRTMHDNIQRFRKFAHISFHSIAIVSDGKITDVNDAMVKLTGYSHEEITNGILKSSIPHKTYERIFREVTEESYELMETTLVTKDGNLKTIEIETKTLPFNNEMVTVVGIRDITSRKHTEEEIVKLSVALDQSANEIIITHKNAEIEYVNRAFSNSTGYLPAEVIGKNPRILKSGMHPPSFYRELWKTLTSGEQWQGVFQNRKKNGELYWESATITPIKNKEGEIVKYIAIKEDITMRKKAEDSLRESEEKFRSMVSNIPGVVYRCEFDENWTILFISEAITGLAGFTPNDFQSNSVTIPQIIHPEDRARVMEAVKTEIRQFRQYNLEYRIITRQNLVKWVSNSGRPVYNEDNTIKWLDGFLFDITDRVTVLEELKKAKHGAEEANNAKSEFLANISHEIRTPLNSVLGFTELLEGLTTDSTQIKYLNSIKASGKNLMMLINDLLDLSKIEAGKMTLHYTFFDIRRLLDEIKNVFSLRVVIKGIGYFDQLDESFPAEIKFDETRLRQILINLVGNAVKFTHEGNIQIRIRAFSKKEVREQRRMKLEIKVIDTGIGIPENSFRLIFESFRQHSQLNSRKYGGTGLGLAITKRLVEAMNGRIRVESKVGKGSVFTVIFPSIEYSDHPTLKNLADKLNNEPGQSSSRQRLDADADEKNQVFLMNGTGIRNFINDNDYEALLKRLEGEMNEQWKLFESKQPLKEIKSFAKDLIGLGLNSRINFITEYGEQLLVTIENFDIEEMRLKLDFFPDLLKQLKKFGHES